MAGALYALLGQQGLVLGSTGGFPSGWSCPFPSQSVRVGLGVWGLLAELLAAGALHTLPGHWWQVLWPAGQIPNVGSCLHFPGQ